MGLRSNLAYLVYGPGSGKKSAGWHAQIIPFPVAPPPVRQSWVYDSHIVTEAASSGKAPQTLSLAWDERDAWGLDLASRSWQGLTPTERKSILLDIYINNPHVSSSVDVISKRIFSGGFTVEKVDEEAKDNRAHYDQLMEFCLRVNPDWDFNQYGRSSIQDELIYGETYTEILWKQGLPFNLVKVDCLTMGYKPDRYGRIDSYYQEMPSTSKINKLDPKNIIRWWFPHPRASIDPFAPAEKVRDAVLIDKKMMSWMTTFFQKGARFQYYIKGVSGENEADRYMTWFDQNVAGAKNAHRPPVTWGNAEFAPLGNTGALEMDFQKGLDRMETIVYGAFGVPPAAVAIIKVGALGGNSGEDQDKSLIFNACDPVKQQWLEKLNYRIVQQGFNIHDYKIGTRYADYRSDESVAKVQDMRIRNGSRTVDETRQEDGKRPYRKGGSVPIIITTKEVTPLPRIDDLEDEQRQTAQQTLAQGDLNNQMLQTKVEQAKNPPTPQPPALPPGRVDQNAQNAKQNAVKQPQQPDEKPVNKTTNKITGKTTQTKESEEPGLQVWRRGTCSCESCQQNDGQVRKAGEAFSSGDIQPGGHDTCDCHLEPVEQQQQDEDANQRPAILQQHTGMMVAFMLDKEIASQLAIPGGEPVEDLHITLAYLGEISDLLGNDYFRLRECVTSFAENAHPLKGVIAGIGRFTAVSDGEPTPVVALPDIPGLPAWREKLIQALTSADFPANQEHGYTPHITLAYIDASAPMPMKDVENLPLVLNKVCLAVGDFRDYFPLGQAQEEDIDPDDTEEMPAIKLPKVKQESDQQLAQIWQPPDIDQRLALLKSSGVVTKEWIGDASMCDAICAPNHKQVVGVDEQFPSGHVDTPGHPHCGCYCIYRDKDGNEVNVPDSYGSDYQ